MSCVVQGLRRVLAALSYLLDGLDAAWRNEAAFRQIVMLAVVLAPVTFFMPVSVIGMTLLVGAVMLVLIAELLNSVLEMAVNRVSLENHPFAKRANDFGNYYHDR
jgi:diacylglycerol kinase (ATP)